MCKGRARRRESSPQERSSPPSVPDIQSNTTHFMWVCSGKDRGSQKKRRSAIAFGGKTLLFHWMPLTGLDTD